jgi:hypothetical protein
MRRIGVDREVNEFLDRVVQVILAPGDGRELQVAGEEFRGQPQDVLPGVVPGPVELGELVLDVLLALRQRH